MLYLPFHDPEACIKTVEHFAEKKGVIGFMVTSTHQRSVFQNGYIRSATSSRRAGLPLAFH